MNLDYNMGAWHIVHRMLHSRSVSCELWYLTLLNLAYSIQREHGLLKHKKGTNHSKIRHGLRKRSNHMKWVLPPLSSPILLTTHWQPDFRVRVALGLCPIIGEKGDMYPSWCKECMIRYYRRKKKLKQKSILWDLLINVFSYSLSSL